MKDSVEKLCSHAARTLPDSISERKTVLRTDSPIYPDVQAQLATFGALENLNLQLKMKFNES